MRHSRKRQEDTRKRSSIDLADEKLYAVSGIVDDAMNVKVKDRDGSDGDGDGYGGDFDELNDEHEPPGTWIHRDNFQAKFFPWWLHLHEFLL